MGTKPCSPSSPDERMSEAKSSREAEASIWSSLKRYRSVSPIKPLRLKTTHHPPIRRVILPNFRRPAQHLIPLIPVTPTHPRPAQYALRDARARLRTLKVSPMQKAVVLRARGLPGEKQPADIRAEILMRLEGRAGRPIRVAPKGPGLEAQRGYMKAVGAGTLSARNMVPSTASTSCLVTSSSCASTR